MKGLFASWSFLAEKWCRVVLAHQHELRVLWYPQSSQVPRAWEM